MDGNKKQSTMKREILKDELDYSEELKLNIGCDEDGSHVAVLYCTVCKTNLCKECSDRVHSLKSLSAHQIVRLIEKPESPMKCPIHPLKKAKLICKDPSCDGMNNPMCTMCHQYETHKGHKYETLDNKYDQIRAKVRNCSKEIEEKKTICDKILEDYDKCISTYSNTRASFVRSERGKIEKFYLTAKKSALKTFDDFAKDRVEKLKLLKNQYISEKLELDKLSLEVRKNEEMRKMELIENGGSVEELMRLSAKQIEKPKDLVPCQDYIVKYPSVGAINIEIDQKHIQLQNQLKTFAVWFNNYSLSCPADYLLKVEEKNLGQLYKYKDGRSVLQMEREPDDSTIGLSQYKYVSLMFCRACDEINDKVEIEKMIRNKLWIRIIVSIFIPDWKNKKDFVERVRQLAATDKRVEVVKFEGIKKIIDLLFQNDVDTV